MSKTRAYNIENLSKDFFVFIQVCAGAHGGQKKSVRFRGAVVTGSSQPQDIGCWESNTPPLQEQQAFLATESLIHRT